MKLVGENGKGSAWITAQLRQAIAAGQYAHGEKLPPERQLAEAFGTSRTTVRAALDQLEADRLVSRRIGSGTFVNTPRRAEGVDVAEETSPLELIEVRLALEPHITRLAVLHATARDIDRLGELIQRMPADPTDIESFSRWDEAFHLALAEATRNPLMISIYRQVNEVRAHSQWIAMKDKVLTPARISDYNREHAAIYEAIRSRDGEGAVALITSHLHQARRQLAGVLGD